MGGGHYEDKNGGGYTVDADRATKAIGNGVGVDPGKRSATQDVAPTAGPLVNQGVACDKPKPGQAGCFLDAFQRQRLIDDIQARISDAGNRFMNACTDERIDRLLEKDTDIPWFLTMALDIFTAFAATRIIEGVKALKAGIPKAPVVEEYWALNETHAAIQTMGIEQPAKLSWKERIKALDDATIVQGTQTAMAQGKAAVGAVIQKEANQPASQKAALLDYLTELQDKAAIAFDAARRSMPAGKSDEELVALDEAWQPGYHLKSAYKDAITAHITAFKASGILQIGRNLTERVPTDEDDHAVSGGPFANTPVRRDVRVAWYHYASGWPKQLVFEHQDAKRSLDGYRNDDPGWPDAPGRKGAARHYNFGPPGAEIDERPMAGIDNTADGAFVIDPQFWEIAIQKHTAAWGIAPEHHTVDESNWNWDPPRQRAARAQKAAKAMKNIPTLQLGKPMQPTSLSQTQALKTASPQPPKTPYAPPVGTIQHRH